MLEEKLAEQSKELQNWKSQHQISQEENIQLQDQLSKEKKTTLNLAELQKKLEASGQKNLARIQNKETKIKDLEKVNSQLREELNLAKEERNVIESKLGALLKENPWLTEKEKINEELGKVEEEIKELKNQKQKLEDYLLDQANYVSPSETTGVFEL